jgi:hypothetical protein
MRLVLSLSAALVASACSFGTTTASGSCAARATTELTALQAAIQTAEENLARGYSVERQLVEGSTQVEEVQMPINAAKEREKLAGLQGRLDATQAQADSALAACGA